jgi:hypothetical protein
MSLIRLNDCERKLNIMLFSIFYFRFGLNSVREIFTIFYGMSVNFI